MNKYKFTKKHDWWTADHYNNFNKIMGMYKGYNDCLFMEIGVYEARTSVFILDNILTGNGCTLICVDPDIQKLGKYNLSFHCHRSILHEEKSFPVLVRYLSVKTSSFDFIYVDGDHNACNLLQDLVLSWKLLKVGGILLADDYEMETLDPYFFKSHREFKEYPGLHFTHPKIAIDAFRNIYRGQYEILIDNYQVGFKKLVDV